MFVPRSLLPAFLALALAPLAAAQQPSFAELESGLDAAVLQLRITVIAERSPFEAIEALERAVRARDARAAELVPQGCSARRRLESAVELLVERARRAQLYFESVQEFVEETEEARLEEELLWLGELVAAGGPIPRERYQRLAHFFERRSQLAIDSCVIPDMHARLMQALEQLYALAERRLATLVHVQALRALVAEERLARAFERLRRRIAAGQATRLEIELFEQRVIEQRNLVLGIPFDPCS